MGCSEPALDRFLLSGCVGLEPPTGPVAAGPVSQGGKSLLPGSGGSPKAQLRALKRTPGAAPAPGQEVGGTVRCAAQDRAEGTLTGLMAHAAQDGAHLHLEISLSLLQALVHQGHHLVRGEVPSVWREKSGWA